MISGFVDYCHLISVEQPSLAENSPLPCHTDWHDSDILAVVGSTDLDLALGRQGSLCAEGVSASIELSRLVVG